jgi:3-phosphoshikimate 1-carboxyvinyltransferase
VIEAISLPDPPALAGPRVMSIRVPGSKSLTNRALLLAGLASGESVLRGALVDADDARRMVDALRVLGAGVTVDETQREVRVLGVGGRWRVPAEGVTLNLNNAGTATRFLAASVLASPAPITIDGNARMRERPIRELTDVLHALGCGVEFLGNPNCPPVRLTPPRVGDAGAGLRAQFGTTQSGQFISALLLLGPFLAEGRGITLRLTGEVTSASYVRMTLGLLARLGASVQTSEDLSLIRVSAERGASAGEGPGGMLPAGFELSIEPDASSATYFAGAAALVPGLAVRLEGLGARSLQGDAMFAQALARMGVPVAFEEDAIVVGGASWDGRLSPILADMSDMPDAAMTLASVAAFASVDGAGGASILRGLRTLRVKETDRIAAMQAEFAKIGVRIEANVGGDAGSITITPPDGGVACGADVERVEFATYDDHRMAMSLALVGLRRPNVVIREPGCVGKTYAGFWGDWAGLWP